MQKQLKAVVLVWGVFRCEGKYLRMRTVFTEILKGGLCQHKELGINDANVKVIFPCAGVDDDNVVVEIKFIDLRLKDTTLLAHSFHLGLTVAAAVMKDEMELSELPSISLLISQH